MEALCDLLFEFSNEERLKILYELEKGPKNLTSIAKDLDFTSQGTSRNIARLIETFIIRRKSDGEYELTSYGNVSLKLLSSYTFLSRNRQYFLSHDASVLPYEFVNRLGELTASSIQEDFVTNYLLEVEMLKEAEEYFYATGDQFNVNARPIIAEKLNLGVEIRTILPETIVPPPGFRPASGPNRRLLPKVQVAITVTEKKAFLGLPTLDGKFDQGVRFVSVDPKFRKWCRNLFNYYWEQSKPIVGAFPNLS
jgi:predicted transcriptional regulator